MIIELLHQFGPLLAVLIPLIGAVFIGITGQSPNVREGVVLITSATLFACVSYLLSLFLNVEDGAIIAVTPIEGLPLRFEIEPLGMVFALIASFLWVITSVYSIGYMRGNQEPNQTRFYICFALALSFAMGIAFADNLLTLFVFYELLTVCTYPLVAHKGNENAKQGARTYLGILMSTSMLFLLTGMVWVWLITGTLDFTLGGILEGKADALTVAALSFLFIYGIGKAALMPIHRWLPAAMVAPTPVSALLHAVAVVKAGVFTVVKVIVYIFGVDYMASLIPQNFWAGGWLLYMSGITIVLASIVALKQDNLKRRLAYSTISQLSYVIFAAAMLVPKSITAAVFHIAAHAFGKITLFFAAGCIYTAAHKTKVSELGGIGRRMKWTMAAFAVGALSMIGVPPAAGFVSKWYMLMGALEIQSWFAILVILASTFLNAAYFLPIIFQAFWGKETGEVTHGEAPLSMVVAITVTAILTLVLFFYPGIFLQLSQMVVQ